MDEMGDHDIPSPQAVASFAEALRQHVALEEDLLFPAIAPLASQEARAWIAAADPEHRVIEDILEDLEECVRTEDHRWRDDLAALARAINEHQDNEEEFIFPEARRLLAEGGLQRDILRSFAAALSELEGGAATCC